jgi:hypothetical protein
MIFNWPTNDSQRIGTLQGLRSERVAQTLPSQEIDDWLKESVALVAGCHKGLGANQRRVRHFGFETTDEQDHK